MDKDDITQLFGEKYESTLGMTYEKWAETGPTNEASAYERLEEIDDELKETEDQWFNAEGEEKDELQEQRDRLRAEYEFIEAIFGLESGDANW